MLGSAESDRRCALCRLFGVHRGVHRYTGVEHAQIFMGGVTIFGITKAMKAAIRPMSTIGFFRYTVGSNFSRSCSFTDAQVWAVTAVCVCVRARICACFLSAYTHVLTHLEVFEFSCRIQLEGVRQCTGAAFAVESRPHCQSGTPVYIHALGAIVFRSFRYVVFSRVHSQFLLAPWRKGSGPRVMLRKERVGNATRCDRILPAGITS